MSDTTTEQPESNAKSQKEINQDLLSSSVKEYDVNEWKTSDGDEYTP